MTDDWPCDQEFTRDPVTHLWSWRCATHEAEFAGYYTLDEAELEAANCGLYPPRRRTQVVHLPEEDVL